MARRTIPGWGRYSGITKRRLRFWGRRWVIAAIDNDEPLGAHMRSKDAARIDPAVGVIAFRTTGDTDDCILSILHELLHEAFPQASEGAVLAAEPKLKDALEAFGVDLSPMIRGYE